MFRIPAYDFLLDLCFFGVQVYVAILDVPVLSIFAASSFKLTSWIARSVCRATKKGPEE